MAKLFEVLVETKTTYIGRTYIAAENFEEAVKLVLNRDEWLECASLDNDIDGYERIRKPMAINEIKHRKDCHFEDHTVLWDENETNPTVKECFESEEEKPK